MTDRPHDPQDPATSRVTPSPPDPDGGSARRPFSWSRFFSGTSALIIVFVLGLYLNAAGFLNRFAAPSLSLLLGAFLGLFVTTFLAFATYQLFRKEIMPSARATWDAIKENKLRLGEHSVWIEKIIPQLLPGASALLSTLTFSSLVGLLSLFLTDLILLATLIVSQGQLERISDQNQLLASQNSLVQTQLELAALGSKADAESMAAQKRFDDINRILSEKRSISEQVYAVRQIPEAMLMAVHRPALAQDCTIVREANGMPALTANYPNFDQLKLRLVTYLREARNASAPNQDVFGDITPLTWQRRAELAAVEPLTTEIVRVLHALGPGSVSEDATTAAESHPCVWRWRPGGGTPMPELASNTVSGRLSFLRDDTVLETAQLSCASLGSARLDGVSLAGAFLQGTDLNRASLNGARLSKARLQGARLRGANARLAQFQFSQLEFADLTEADLRGASLDAANLVCATLGEVRLQAADLIGADLRGASLPYARAHSARLTFAHLDIANLSHAVLQDATFENATLVGANLESVRAEGINLLRADLRAVDLTRARLCGASLAGARLHGVKLAGVIGSRGRFRLTSHLATEPGASRPWYTFDPVVSPASNHGAADARDIPAAILTGIEVGPATLFRVRKDLKHVPELFYPFGQSIAGIGHVGRVGVWCDREAAVEFLRSIIGERAEDALEEFVSRPTDFGPSVDPITGDRYEAADFTGAYMDEETYEHLRHAFAIGDARGSFADIFKDAVVFRASAATDAEQAANRKYVRRFNWRPSERWNEDDPTDWDREGQK